MKSVVCVLMASAISIGFMSCDSVDSASRPMPSAEQKAQLQDVEASESRAQAVIPTNGIDSQSRSFVRGSIAAAQSGDTRDLLKALSSASVTSDDDDLRDRMTDQLTESVDNGDCSVSKVGLDGATSGAIDPMAGMSGSLMVSGSRCPVSFNLSLSSQKNSDLDFSISSAIQYAVNDDSYRELNDVDSITFAVKFGVTAGDSTAVMSASIDGKIHSLKYGVVTETAHGSGGFDRNGGSFDMTVTDTFPTFSIDRGLGFTIDSSGQKSFHYSVNGNSVSKEEFNSYGDVDAPSF